MDNNITENTMEKKTRVDKPITAIILFAAHLVVACLRSADILVTALYLIPEMVIIGILWSTRNKKILMYGVILKIFYSILFEYAYDYLAYLKPSRIGVAANITEWGKAWLSHYFVEQLPIIIMYISLILIICRTSKPDRPSVWRDIWFFPALLPSIVFGGTGMALMNPDVVWESLQASVLFIGELYFIVLFIVCLVWVIASLFGKKTHSDKTVSMLFKIYAILITLCTAIILLGLHNRGISAIWQINLLPDLICPLVLSYWIVNDKDPIISLSHIKSKDVKDVLNKAVAPVAVLATGIYALFCNIINFSVPQAELSISLNTVDLLGIVFGKPEETKWADWLNSNKIPSAMISEDLLIGITVLMGISVFAVCWMALWGILSSKSEGRVSKYTYVAGIGLVIPCVVGLITNSMIGKEVDKYLLDYGDGLLTPEQLRKMGNITQSTDMWIPFVIGALICAVAFVVTNLDKIKARLGNVQAPQHKPESKEMETIEAIAGYKKLLDDGIITEEEFAEKKSELLNQK